MEIQHALVDLQYLAVLLIDEVSKERKIQKKSKCTLKRNGKREKQIQKYKRILRTQKETFKKNAKYKVYFPLFGIYGAVVIKYQKTSAKFQTHN